MAEAILQSGTLAAPHLTPIEAANILRHAALARDLSQDAASLAYADLMQLRVDLFPYEVVGRRVWELRDTITSYDATYVALASKHLRRPCAGGPRASTLDVRRRGSP